MIESSKLRKQLLLAFLVACIAILSAQTIIRFVWILPTFEVMAKQNDLMDIQRVESQFQQQIDSLAKLVYDSAAWDTMHDAAIHNHTDWFNGDYVIADALQRLDINGWYLYGPERRLVGGGSFTNRYELFNPKEFESADFLKETQLLVSFDEVAQSDQNNVSKVRFLNVNGEPAISVAHNVTRSDATGEHVGTLLLWSYVDEPFIENLTPGIKGDIDYYYANEAQALSNQLSKKFGVAIGDMQPKAYNQKLYIGFDDQDGELLFVLSIPIRERTFDSHLFDSSLTTGLLISGTVLILFYIFINNQLLTPVGQLLQTVTKAIKSENFSAHDIYKGNNELNQLGRRMNELFILIETQRRELIERNANLECISNTDSLTELANRRSLDIHLEKLKNKLLVNPETLSLLVIDVDFFKLYNDHYGHSQGDEALRKIAKILIGNTHQTSDFVARYGGEEFVVVLRNTNEEQASQVAENLRHAVQVAAIAHLGRGDCPVITISIGTATKPHQAELDADLLFKAADDALYRAKSQGRNCTVVSGFSIVS